MKKVLVVDNYDSFVFNLVQMLRESELCLFDVVKVDMINSDMLDQYSHILLSPGPGLPEEFSNLHDIIEATYRSHSILGVCLGFQAIVNFFGGRLKQLEKPKHGVIDQINIVNDRDRLLKNLRNKGAIGRYHSWIADLDYFPEALLQSAVDGDGNITSFSHKDLSIYGVQFHPESYMTEQGCLIIRNWLLEDK